MYRKINDFLVDWQYETEGTAKILKIITDDRRAQTIHGDVRSLERLAWHLTQTLTEMGHREGFFSTDHLEHQKIPATMAEGHTEEYLNATLKAYSKYDSRLQQLNLDDLRLKHPEPAAFNLASFMDYWVVIVRSTASGKSEAPVL